MALRAFPIVVFVASVGVALCGCGRPAAVPQEPPASAAIPPQVVAPELMALHLGQRADEVAKLVSEGSVSRVAERERAARFESVTWERDDGVTIAAFFGADRLTWLSVTWPRPAKLPPAEARRLPRLAAGMRRARVEEILGGRGHLSARHLSARNVAGSDSLPASAGGEAGSESETWMWAIHDGARDVHSILTVTTSAGVVTAIAHPWVDS